MVRKTGFLGRLLSPGDEGQIRISSACCCILLPHLLVIELRCRTGSLLPEQEAGVSTGGQGGGGGLLGIGCDLELQSGTASSSRNLLFHVGDV